MSTESNPIIDKLDVENTGYVDEKLNKKLEGSIDAVFLDVNVILSSCEGRRQVSKIPVESLDEDFIEEGYGEFLGEGKIYWDIVEPAHNLKFVRDLEESDIDVYYPNHLADCVDSGSYQRREQKGYKNFRHRSDAVYSFIAEKAEPVDVKSKMGLNSYTRDTFVLLNPGKDEDDFIEEAAEDKNATVATYDSDFLDRNVDAATPRRIAVDLGI